jgi:hypothetical protein
MAEITYKADHIRIARMGRSAYQSGTPTNLATHTLFNNSSGPNVLVVMRVSVWIATADLVVGGVTRAPAGAALGAVSPFVTGGQPPAGLHYYADTASALTPVDFIPGPVTALNVWDLSFPLLALQPGFGFVIQNSVSAHAMPCSFVWAFLDPADLFFSNIFDQP